MMKRTCLLIVLSFCTLFAQNTYSQVVTEYYPEGDALKALALPNHILRNEIVHKMPSFDVEKMRKEDAEMEGLDVPYRVGKRFDVLYTLEDGQWEDIENGRIWCISFKSEGALSLNYVFENFYLPEGASLYIANQDETVLYGPVTSEAMTKQYDSFLTDVIPGDQSTIYLYEPSERIGESTLTIRRVVHGYRGVDINSIIRSLDGSSSCNINVACYPEYEKESNAVALVLLSSGNELCSGSLLMNTNYTFDPYFLTAFHCIDGPYGDGSLSDSEIQAAENWMFKFCFKKTTCNGNSLATSYTYNKADFCSAWYNTDFALMKLKGTVSRYKNLTWLGWDKSGSTPSSGVSIHHPQGDVMKISYDNDAALSAGINGYSNNAWYVDFDYGITQHGSSGSPLLNQNNRVVGQLKGGPHPDNICDWTNRYYGKISLSWTGGGHSYDRLSDWLDPINTGQTTIDSYRAPYISGPLVLQNTCDYSIENLPSGFTVSWSYIRNAGVDVTFQPNIPSTNKCRLIHNNALMTDITLQADIYNGSTLVFSLSINPSYYPPYIGTYSQNDNYNATQIWNIPVTDFYEGDILYLRPKCNINIYSTLFVGSSVTYSGDSPEIWSNDNNGNIMLRYPYSAHTHKYTTITATRYGQQLCSIDLHVYPIIDPIIPPIDAPILLTGSSGKTLSVTITDKETLDSGRKGNGVDDKDIIWTLTITNLLTGRQVYWGTVEGRTRSITTTDWPSGTYAIQAQIGDKVIIQKQVVK